MNTKMKIGIFASVMLIVSLAAVALSGTYYVGDTGARLAALELDGDLNAMGNTITNASASEITVNSGNATLTNLTATRAIVTDGSGIQGISGTNVDSGTVADARIASTITRTNAQTNQNMMRYNLNNISKIELSSYLVEGLYAYFPLDNSPNDVIRNIAPTQIYNVTNTSIGMIDGAYVFNGTSRIAFASGFLPQRFHNGTYCAWFYPYSVPYYPVTITGAGYMEPGIRIYNSTIRVNVNAGQDLVSISSPENKWWHVCHSGTKSGNYKTYVNGELKSTKAMPNANEFFYQTHWTIGGNYPSSGSLYQKFNGTIDDVRVYTRELSGTEITYIYNIEKRFYINNTHALLPITKFHGDVDFKGYSAINFTIPFGQGVWFSNSTHTQATYMNASHIKWMNGGEINATQ